MTRNFRQGIWFAWLLGLAMPIWAAQQPTFTSRQPATVEGTLNFARMQYWIETATGEHIMLTPEEEDEPLLLKKISQPVSLNGFKDTYSDGSIYFVPTFAPTPSSSSPFTIVKNDDYSIEIQQGEEVLQRTEEYDAIKIKHQLPLPNGQAVLFELYSGGVACPLLYQLAVAQQGALTMLSRPFGTCSDLGKFSHDANGFALDLPGNPSERWVWDSSSMTLRKQS